MTKEHLIVFHSKTSHGWKPGSFMGRTRITPETAEKMNQQFNASGVRVLPYESDRRVKSFTPFHIE